MRGTLPPYISRDIISALWMLWKKRGHGSLYYTL